MSDHDKDFDAAIGNQTRASEWRSLRKALAERLRNLRASEKATTDEDELIRLARQVETIEAQLETIQLEEAVAEFVENSIKYTINSNRLLDESEGYE